jgi:hypothetical protein
MTKRKPKPLNDLRHTALHEAGHAVIGRVLTLVCGGVSTEPSRPVRPDLPSSPITTPALTHGSSAASCAALMTPSCTGGSLPIWPVLKLKW